jgi:hypothetical protein
MTKSQSTDILAKGQRVRVYPHGNPSQSALATVAIISQNQLSIAVGFGDKPPFATVKSGGICVHPDYGVIMLASRVEIDGKPWGPWVETVGGGHYEIEAAN